MTKIKNKMYRYEITLEGKGGEFSIVPMTLEQVAYWREQGNTALADHLHHGWDDDDKVPLEMQLGSYFDYDDCYSGIDIESEGSLIVRDQDGTICFNTTLSELDFHSVEIERAIYTPTVGAFFRTCEKAAQIYKLKLSEPFDPSKLSLRATALDESPFINGVNYMRQEISDVIHIDKDRGLREAWLLG